MRKEQVQRIRDKKIDCCYHFISNMFEYLIKKSKGYLMGMFNDQCASIGMVAKYYFNKN